MKRRHHTAFFTGNDISRQFIAARGHRSALRLHRSHFPTHHEVHMDVGEHQETKKGKNHEAHIIPGIDGRKIFGFPNSIITKLRYCDYFAITSSSGSRAIQVMSANGIFDPDVTGGGHQPLWRDNYAAIWNNYVVIGSKITVHFAPRASGVNFVVGIDGEDSSAISTVVDTCMEQSNSIWTVVGVPGGPTKTLTLTFEPMESFGVDAKDDGASSTVVGANPNQGWFYGIFAATMDGSTGIMDIAVEVDYTVKFMGLVTPTQN